MKPSSFYFSFLLVFLPLLVGCEHGGKVQKDPSPSVKSQPSPTSPAPPTLIPTPTKSAAEIKYEKKYPKKPTPTPLPLGINSFGCEPRVFLAGKDRQSGQLLVFINQIVYEKIKSESISFELNGQPAKGIEISGTDLFEAQDLIVNFIVSDHATIGRYDARIIIKDQSFFP